MPNGHWIPTAALALSALAALLCIWLTVKSFSELSLPGCGANSGCDAVLSSRWSRWGAIPVAAPAVLLYAVIFVLGLLIHPASGWQPPDVLHSCLAGMILWAAASALWFMGLQVFVVGRICGFCTVIHLCGLALGVGEICSLATGRGLHQPISPGLSGGIAAAGTILLVGGQLVLEPKLYSLRVSRRAHCTGSGSPMNDSCGQHTPTLAPPAHSQRRLNGRDIAVLEGRIPLHTGQWPMLGSPEAPHVLVYLFDYTCPTCRKTHGLLLQAVANFGPRLSILMVPAPVDPSCNRHIQKQTAIHAHACRYARLGLMVWSLDPGKYEAFDHWIFSGDELPPLGIAVRHAEELLDTHGLDPSMPDPAIDRFITQGVAMYKAAGSANMPILLFPHAILTGLVPSAERLRTIFEEQFSDRDWVKAV